jgi:HD-GYP domain-containing protein (c-di-GMP phosphodiesterase class II)
MVSLLMPKGLRSEELEDAALDVLPDAIFGRNGWAVYVTRALARRLFASLESGEGRQFADAVGVAAHAPSLGDVRSIANAVCDAAVSQAVISGEFSERFTAAVLQLRKNANAVLDRLDEESSPVATPAETLSACDTLLQLVSVSRPDLRKHLEAVSTLGRRIVRRLDLTADALEATRLAGLLHDIGHLTTGTDPALAERDPGHATLAERTLAGIEPLRHLAPIVRAHHEHFDGTGQPDGLRGAEIPIEARIIAVADAFEHLANRPGRTNPIAAAVSELWQDAGSVYDPDVVAVVTRLFNQHWRVRRKASGAP